MSAADSILATRFYLPPMRPGLVGRPRLTARLNEGLSGPLTLVSAPAGFGKTALISEWRASAAGRQASFVWLALDRDDNALHRFLGDLAAALRTLDPGLGEAALAQLRAPQPPSYRATLTALIDGLAGQEGVLALDDFHVVTAPEVHEALGFFVDRLPAHLHLAILSRAELPSPLARGRLTEIRGRELRFSDDEAAQYLNDVMKLGLSGEDVAALQARAEGRIAGLHLAALLLAQEPDRHAFVAAFAGDDRDALAYLLEEAFLHHSPDVQAFMLQTAVLDRLCGPLCDAVTAGREGGSILRSLEQADQFVAPLDDRGTWYRYHPLLADLLKRRLRQIVERSEWLALYARACAWHEREGLIAEAVSLALSAPDFEHAADLLERHALTAFFRGEVAQIHAWLTGLPDPVLRGRPLLCGLYANTLALTGSFETQALDAAADWLLAAQWALVETLSAPGSADLPDHDLTRGFLAFSRACLARWRDEPPARVIALAQQALDGLPAADAQVGHLNFLRLRSGLNFNLGISLRRSGDESAAARAFAEARRAAEACGDPSDIFAIAD